jgi:hypothetical protein
MFTSVQPQRAPGSDFSGLAYQPTSGNPINMGKGLISPPGASAGTPISRGAGEILRDTPGKRSNATIQYSYVVPAGSVESQEETKDLHTAGTLAYGMPFGAKTLYGMAVDRNKRARGAAGSKGPDRQSRLVSHSYLTTPTTASDPVLDLGTAGVTAYQDVYGSGPKQRIAHLSNIAGMNSQVPTGVPINIVGAAALDLKGLTDAAGSVPAADNPCFNLYSDVLKLGGPGFYEDNFYTTGTAAEAVARAAGRTAAQVAADGVAADAAAGADAANALALNLEVPEYLRRRAARQAFVNGFELRARASNDQVNMLASPFLVPYGWVSNAANRPNPYDVQPYTTDGGGRSWPLGTLYTENAKGTRGVDVIGTDRIVGGQKRGVFAPFEYDIRTILYDALYFNERGLFSEWCIEAWRPIGFVLYKYSTFGYDSRAEEALDARQNALFNVSVGGQTIVTQLSTLVRELGGVASGTGLTQRASAARDRWSRLLTMPGDLLYVVVVGEVVRKGDSLASNGGTNFDPTNSRPNSAFLTNVRLELTTSEEMTSDATPKGTYGVGAGVAQNFSSRTARMGKMGLGDNELIVGGWQLGTVIDNAASRAMPLTPNGVTIQDPATYGLNVLMGIKWVNGLTLHEKYWSRRT